MCEKIHPPSAFFFLIEFSVIRGALLTIPRGIVTKSGYTPIGVTIQHPLLTSFQIVCTMLDLTLAFAICFRK
jgi:hypothetical protein